MLRTGEAEEEAVPWLASLEEPHDLLPDVPPSGPKSWRLVIREDADVLFSEPQAADEHVLQASRIIDAPCMQHDRAHGGMSMG